MSRRSPGFAIAIAIAIVVVFALGCGTQRTTTPRSEDEVAPFLAEYCVGCHGPSKQSGGLRLDVLGGDFGRDSVARWREVIERLSAGDMPPRSISRRPSGDEVVRIVEWLTERIAEAESGPGAERTAMSFHRLSREEYANTIRDLLGVHVDVAGPDGLDEDDRLHGFERIGSNLSMSRSHVEKHLRVAESIVGEAFPATAPEKRTSKTFGHESWEKLPRSRIDLWPGQVCRTKPVRVDAPGLYRFRVKVSGLPSIEKRPPHLVVRVGERLVFARDVIAAESAPRTIEFRAHLPVGQHELGIGNDVRGPLLLAKIGRSRAEPFVSLAEGAIPWQIPLLDDAGAPLYPVLVFDWIEWSGPVVDSPELRGRFRGHGGLARFAELAFRRPLRRGELEVYEQLARETGAPSASFLAVLCSPDFLYLAEGPGPELDDWQLASRLSYFLWGSLPDAKLLDLARRGSLAFGATLRKQVSRMLGDAKAERFFRAFARQWLQLDRVGRFAPDTDLYPDYDGHLERSMVRETIGFFGEVVRRDLPLRQLFASDWSVVNARLARHYGMPRISGDEFRIAKLPGSRRGGVLTHASVLSLTSDGIRHRPVHRGVWFLESVFGKRPAPPPANVEPIAPIATGAAKASFRKRLEAHREDPSCAACHRRIDPYGLAYESFDAIGRFREHEHVPSGVGKNPPVDASGVLADGRAFANTADFHQLLLDDIDRLAEAFVTKLATFALRRVMTLRDRPEIERIVRSTAAGGYRLRALVEALVVSRLFRGR